MTRHLYKAKNLQGEWVEGWYFEDILGKPLIKYQSGTYLYDCTVNPETVCQCTGLKDKSGKFIFEGDIVTVKMSHKGGFLPHQGEVVYDSRYCGFATKNEAGETLFHHHLISSFEIIGNIHDTKPEEEGV